MCNWFVVLKCCLIVLMRVNVLCLFFGLCFSSVRVCVDVSVVLLWSLGSVLILMIRMLLGFCVCLF